ncbi:hypothetical protein PSAB6_30129 [Paraburkholderia sabiae]|nr:hypothetical protein PSAB6_30129 [Paraburkholderia sabiae]
MRLLPDINLGAGSLKIKQPIVFKPDGARCEDGWWISNYEIEFRIANILALHKLRPYNLFIGCRSSTISACLLHPPPKVD